MSSGPRPFPWQDELWLELSSLALQKRLSHALLLAGPAGVGKRGFARALAAFLLCESRSGYACGRCRSCLQLQAGTQPDAHLLSVDGHLAMSSDENRPDNALAHWEPRPDSKRRDIAIGAVQSLIAQTAQASHYGGSRIVLVEPADALNESSVNALLKLVEEPPLGTHILFVSERPSALKPTLRSRCQRVRFAVPDAGVAQAWLDGQGVREPDALAMAQGAPLLALSLQGEGLALRRQWSELWLAVARGKRDPLSAAASVEKEQVQEHLSWINGWLTTELRTRLRKGPVAGEAFEQMMTEVIEAQRRAAGNAQPQLLMESLLVQWQRLGRQALA